MFCSPLAPGQTHLQLRVYFLNNTPCALQWAITNEQPHGGRMRGPCQLFDFTGARADQCLRLKYISEGEGSGPQGRGIGNWMRGRFKAPALAFQEIQKRQVYFLDMGSQWPCDDLLEWIPFLHLPLSPCQPATPEERDAS